MDIYNSLSKYNDHALPSNFVSIAVQVSPDNLIPYHAGILIRYQSVDYLHHFPGATPPLVEEDFDKNGWYVYKVLDCFHYDDESEIGAMLQYFRRVCAASQITYSYTSDGSGYDHRGEFNSRVGLPELGTCVGFCLNSLNNAIVDVQTSILFLDDWDNTEFDERIDLWSQNNILRQFPDLDWDLYNSFKKRITPLEYLCVAYHDTYPIKKDSIDSLKEEVLKEIQLLYLAN